MAVLLCFHWQPFPGTNYESCSDMTSWSGSRMKSRILPFPIPFLQMGIPQKRCNGVSSFFHTWGRNSCLASLFVVTGLLSKYDFVEVTKWKTCNMPAPKASMLSVSAFSLWDMDDSSPCFSLLLRSTQNTVSSIKGMFNLVWQILHADSSRLSDSSSTKIFLRCMKSKLCFHPWKSGSSANWYTPVISPN